MTECVHWEESVCVLCKLDEMAAKVSFCSGFLDGLSTQREIRVEFIEDGMNRARRSLADVEAFLYDWKGKKEGGE